MQAAFNFKSTRLDALLVQPQSNDAAALAAQWQQQADKYRTFAAMPLVLDLDALADAEKLDIAAVCALFKEHGFTPVALRHSKRDWEKTAAANNLLFVAADKAKAKTQPLPKGSLKAQRKMPPSSLNKISPNQSSLKKPPHPRRAKPLSFPRRCAPASRCMPKGRI